MTIIRRTISSAVFVIAFLVLTVGCLVCLVGFEIDSAARKIMKGGE